MNATHDFDESLAYPAGWLFDRLAAHFGAGRVFKDVDSIQFGDDFLAAMTDLPRAFRTADLWLIHAADCCSRYSSWTCCGVRY